MFGSVPSPVNAARFSRREKLSLSWSTLVVQRSITLAEPLFCHFEYQSRTAVPVMPLGEYCAAVRPLAGVKSISVNAACHWTVLFSSVSKGSRIGTPPSQVFTRSPLCSHFRKGRPL